MNNEAIYAAILNRCESEFFVDVFTVDEYKKQEFNFNYKPHKIFGTADEARQEGRRKARATGWQYNPEKTENNIKAFERAHMTD